jgi:hypothetical protein
MNDVISLAATRSAEGCQIGFMFNLADELQQIADRFPQPDS